jgi:hypothetical protein
MTPKFYQIPLPLVKPLSAAKSTKFLGTNSPGTLYVVARCMKDLEVRSKFSKF